MKKKNGFISTAVVYSFFTVFLMMLLFIVRGYATNRTFLSSIKADIKEEINGYSFTLISTNTITGQDATLTNMIRNGSFESDSSYWSLSNTSVVADHHSDGGKALLLRPNVTAMSTQTIATASAPTVNHVYYGRLKFLSTSDFTTVDNRFEWYYTDTDQALMVFANKTDQTTDWKLLSKLGQITANTYTSRSWYIRNFQVNANKNSYVDELMLIDLTASYGAEYPTQNFLDTLPYFDNTVYIKTIRGKQAEFTVNTSGKNITCTGGTAMKSPDNSKVTVTRTGTNSKIICQLK